MMRWFRSLFAWHAVRSTAVWIYWENAVTGQRAASLKVHGLYSPLDWTWLRDGDIVDGHRGRFIVGAESEIING